MAATVHLEEEGLIRSADLLAMALGVEKEALFHKERLQGVLERGCRERKSSAAHTKREGEK